MADGDLQGLANVANQAATQYVASADSKKARQHDKYMWDKTNEQNLINWNMQNEYNSPKAQMARLQEGGLNPAQIYGGSNSGAFGNVSAPSKVAAAPSAKLPVRQKMETPMNDMMSFQNIQQSKAQTDNLITQNSLLRAQTLLAQSGAAKNMADTTYKGQENDAFKILLETQLQALQEDIAGKKLTNIGQGISNVTNDATQQANIQSATLSLKNATATLTGTDLKNQMQNIINEYADKGINWNDKPVERAVQNILYKTAESLGKSAPALIEMFTAGIRKLKNPLNN
jgi:hypothetical protein